MKINQQWYPGAIVKADRVARIHYRLPKQKMSGGLLFNVLIIILNSGNRGFFAICHLRFPLWLNA
jgi:hypothetical protein